MIRRLLSILTCLIMLICFVLMPAAVTPVSAASSTGKTIKVAVLNNSIYAYQDKNKVWRGMDVEVMINVAQKTGMKIKFVDSSTDPDFLGNLDKGKYDIVADVVKTSDRKSRYLFTDEVIGTINSTLAVRSNDSRWTYGDINQVSKMKIGVLSSYANNNDFRNWCSEHGVSPVIKEYADINEMSKALESGKIDGEVYNAGVGTGYTSKFHTILKLLPESYYFAFRKNDVRLKNKVDEGIAQILSGNIDYLLTLKSKYETQFKSNVLPISSKEKAYIKRHPTITVGVLNGNEPYYKKSDKGIIPDYYKLLANYSGLKFKYKTYDTQNEMVKAEKNGDIDIIGLYIDGIISAYQKGFALTDSFTTVNNVMLTRQGTSSSKVKKIAVKKSAYHSLSDLINQNLKGVTLVGYDNADECFKAMKTGKVEALIVGLPSATWLINQNNVATYSVAPVPGMTTELCSAVDADNVTLCTIMNKSIDATKSSFNGIVTKDTVPENDWKTTISRIPPLIIVLVLLALLILVLGLVWALIMLRRRQKERGELLAAQNEARLQKVQAEESQKSVDAKNTFFSNISHDMRTPLNAIVGFTNMARRKDISEEKRDEYLSKVEDSSNLLLELINDTLVLSKVNSGKLELNQEPDDFGSVVKEIIVPVTEIAKQKNISVEIDESGFRSRMVLMDRLNVQKIFLNIINNAVKYTQSGGHIWISVKDDPPDAYDPDIVVTVMDDGIGITEEFMPRLFDPFSQEKRHGYESVGTGLGLSIVKQLIDLMGGTIDVQSEKNNGTTFTVRLHLEEVDGVKLQESVESIEHSIDISGKKCLICEDNMLNREIAIELLEVKGVAVDAAEDGEAGVQKFTESNAGEYDFILMDVRMPHKDGFETTKEIRAMDRPDAAMIPIIAMTADAFDDDIKKCLDAGMNAHIAKPIDANKLYDIIFEYINKK